MKNSLNLCITVLIFVVLGCSCPSKLSEMANNKKSSPTPIPSYTPSSPTSSPTSPKGEYDVTMDKYDQIKIGSPRSDIERILGGKGTEISSSKGGSMSFSVNKWEGEKYKSIILSFKNDKVMSKSQVGLK